MQSIRTFILIPLLFFSLCALAQKEKTVEVDAEYYYDEDVSKANARQHVLNQARLNAIKKAFPGTIIAQENTLVLSSNTSGDAEDFYSFSKIASRGEIIKEDYRFVKLPENEIGQDGFRCILKARVRELWNKPEFSWSILHNGVDEKDSTTVFVEGDHLYLSFDAPCDGYLAVYCIYGDYKTAQCLIPHQKDGKGIYRIRGGQHYVFFAPQVDNGDGDVNHWTDELIPFCAGEHVEYPQFYAIFSKREFTCAEKAKKANRSQRIGGKDYSVPPELSYRDFENWLTRQRINDEGMQIEIKQIKILKRGNDN